MRLAARRDTNEDELVGVARQFGARWTQQGPLDGWVGYRGLWVPVEVKHGANDFTPAQVRFMAMCKEARLPFWAWRTSVDVFESLGAKQTA